MSAMQRRAQLTPAHHCRKHGPQEPTTKPKLTAILSPAQEKNPVKVDIPKPDNETTNLKIPLPEEEKEIVLPKVLTPESKPPKTQPKEPEPKVIKAQAPPPVVEVETKQQFFGEWNSPANTPRNQKAAITTRPVETDQNKFVSMELEKLEIQNQNLRDKLDTLQQEKREQEHEIRRLTKELETTQKKLQRSEDSTVNMREKMADLKLQVREELMRNDHLDQKVSSLEHVQTEMTEKDKKIFELQKRLEETTLLLQHSKKAFSKELDKNKDLQKKLEEEKKMRKYDELVTIENETLKGLISAKDSMLTHKSRVIEMIKSIVKQNPGAIDSKVIKHALSSVSQEGDANDGKWNLVAANGMRNGKQGFMESILDSGKSSDRQISSAKGRFQQGSFSDFRSDSESFVCRQQVIVKRTIGKDDKPPPKNGYTIRRWQTVKVVPASARPRTAGGGMPSPQLRRSHTMRNTLSQRYGDNNDDDSDDDDSMRRPSTASQAPSSPVTTSSTLMSINSSQYMNGDDDISTRPPSTNMSYGSTLERDILYLRSLKVGDRVIAEFETRKGEKKRRRGGIIKFIGQVDKEYDCGRLYTGLRLDEPVGDTDGVYKGKRYFTCTTNHGIFLKVTSIVKVFDKESSTFMNIEDRIEHLRMMSRGDVVTLV